MASAGTVTVDFAAETAKFTADLRKVNDSLKQMNTGFDTVSRVARNFLPAVSVAALASFAKASFDAADALGDAAKRIGVTTEELSRLKFAAEQNDVEFGTLTTSVTRYLKTLSEANTGNRAAISTFNDLGLSAAALRNVSLDQQLGQIADAFQKVPNSADRTRIAIELFGRSGAELIPLLQGGSEEIAKLADEADRLGVTLSTTTAAGINALESAWKRFKASVGGTSGNLLGGIGLALFGTDDAVINMQQQLQKLQIYKSQLLATPGGDKTPAFGDLEQQIIALETRLKALSELKAGIQSQSSGGRRGNAPIGPAVSEFQIFGAAAQGEKEQSGWQVVAEANAEFQRSILETTRNIQVEALAESGQLALEAQRELGSKVNEEIESQLSNEAAMRNYYAQQRYKQESLAESSIVALKKATYANVMNAMQAFAGNSKKVAIALVAIEKAHAIAQAIQLGHVAIAHAAALPWPANIPAIAWAKGFMALNVAAIAATGIGQISSINAGSGPGASLGSPANPVFTDSGTNAAGDDARTFGASSQTVAQVIVQGSVFSGRETADWLIETLRDAVDGRDVVIIGPNSQQAAMLGAT